MTRNPEIRRLASRAAANLVAVIAITAIFGLKAYIDAHGLSPIARANATEFTYSPTNVGGLLRD